MNIARCWSVGAWPDQMTERLVAAAAVTSAATAATAFAATATTAAATTTETAAAGFARLGFVDGERAAVLFLAVERGDRGLRFLVRAHLHKPKALAAAGVAVCDHFSGLNLAMRTEQLLELRAVDVVA